MKKYNHTGIEKKWQEAWERAHVYRTHNDSKKQKMYVLDMFPYPSGEGLHVGHPKGYIGTDIYSRYKRMCGYEVLHPMGWDAFGLPAENYALKNKVHPRFATEKNVIRYKQQLSIIGLSYDWEREINTTDPAYYRWTQWIFLKLFEKGLAYESFEPINWCPSCKTGLANEDLEAGKCERCGSDVEKKPMRQWVLRITQYADKLLEGLDTLAWADSIKEMQRNWIGRSEGVEIQFPLFGIPGQDDGKHTVTVFTTRPDTVFGATFLVISAELAKKWIAIGWQASPEIQAFVEKTMATEMQRGYGEIGEKEGIPTGLYAENPVNKEKIPVWIANYVLSGYGTGAIMAVPAHDERDGEFARKFNLPIREVIRPVFGEHHEGEVLRKTISATVQRKSDGKFLFLKWKQFQWIAPVIGGIEEGETPEAAAEREVLEEAGIRAKAVQRLGSEIEDHFFADNKNEWRYRIDQPILLDIVTEGEPDAEGKEKFEVVWLSAEEAMRMNTFEYNGVGLKRYLGHTEPFTGYGRVINSDFLDGLSSSDAQQKIIEWLVQNGCGKKTVSYKLKDWVFSRQRYWGEPIPIIHCPQCGAVPVPEDQLPVTLPDVEQYEPTGTGESPLAAIASWVHTVCPRCGGEGKRETNTMPQWAGSSWYHLRYIDPQNTTMLVDKEKERYWMPVDRYVGGVEHATRHLIYARFWHRFLYDIGVVTSPEPYRHLTGIGLILAGDGRKMSKRWGNVINPDDIIIQVGADTLRMYEMFMGPFTQAASWNTDSMIGVRKFLERVWQMGSDKNTHYTAGTTIRPLLYKSIKKISEGIDEFRFNTCVSQYMIVLNAFEKEAPSFDEWILFLKLLSPFAPHISEELWHILGNETFLVAEEWPVYDETKAQDEVVTVAVQIQGKMRGTVLVAAGADQETVYARVLEDTRIKGYVSGVPKKIIFVQDKIINVIL